MNIKTIVINLPDLVIHHDLTDEDFEKAKKEGLELKFGKNINYKILASEIKLKGEK